MNITVAQAVATILRITVEPSPIQGAPDMYVMDGERFESVGRVSLEEAVRLAMQKKLDLGAPCNFAIFPITTERGEFYMQIERECLRQEAALNPPGPLWQALGSDPREIITMTFEVLRACATTITIPQAFQSNLLRVGCIVIAALQWCHNWIGALRTREAVRMTMDKDKTKIVRMSPDEIMEQNNICSKHDEMKPCRECEREHSFPSDGGNA